MIIIVSILFLVIASGRGFFLFVLLECCRHGHKPWADFVLVYSADF